MNSCDIEYRVAEYAKEQNLFSKDDKVIVALSGGADSVALLRVLLACGVQCSALHCNFGLRGEESNRDETFVRQMCEQNGISLKVKSFDVAEYEQTHKVSTEMACRELRYAWFEEERVAQSATAIAVAHHHDDSVETFFLNLLRGSGLQGLVGIRPRNGYVVRPLLCVTRAEIENYLAEIGQDYVTDSTNLENEYKRNRIRNVIIPSLKELFPDYATGLSRSLHNLQGCNDFYQNAVERLKNDMVDRTQENVTLVNLSSLKDLSKGKSTAVFELIREYGFNSQSADAISKHIESNTTETHYFHSDNFEAALKNEMLEIYPIECDVQREYCVNLNKLLNTDDARLEFVVSVENKEKGVRRIQGVDGKTSIALSVNILEENPMIVSRSWKKGDTISPYGMKGTKLVSDLLSDNKYTAFQKRNTRILATSEGTVLWVLNLRASRQFSVKPEDEKYLKITLK